MPEEFVKIQFDQGSSGSDGDIPNSWSHAIKWAYNAPKPVQYFCHVYTVGEVDAQLTSAKNDIGSIRKDMGTRLDTQENVLKELRAEIIKLISNISAEIINENKVYEAIKERLAQDDEFYEAIKERLAQSLRSEEG
jgi:hypothetical protein